MKILGLLALMAMCVAAEPRIVYSKSFPGSVPAFVIIELNKDGAGVYREALDDQWPLKFKLDTGEAAEIYRLAEKLEFFKRPLESGLKVANMGMKTLRWEDGAAKQEVKFNYSIDEDAKAIADWFEKMVETEQHFIRLERTVKYDRLGVNQSLLQMEMSQDKKRLVAPEQFLPLLDRVAKNESYMHMARERAARLADTIRARKSPPAE